MTDKRERPENGENPMKRIEIEKVVINIGVGEAGEKLLRAEKVLRLLTGQEPIQTISRTTNRDLGIRRGMPIGCKVTVRGEKAYEFLKKALWVKDFRLPHYCFDPEGNFSFGIPDYTDFKEMKYDPDIGIFGMDICVSLKRKGWRIKYRRRGRGKIPHRHRISKHEGIEFARNVLGVDVREVG